MDETQSLGNEDEKDEDGLHRLSDIRPVEVSIVHPPANQEEFHIVKSEGIMHVELKEREDGTFEIAEKSAEEQAPAEAETTETETAAPAEPTETTTEAPAETATDQGTQEVTQKVEGKLSRGAREGAERLLSLANQAKAMKLGDKMTPAMLRELKAVSTMLSALQQKYPSPTSKALGVELEMLAKSDDPFDLFRTMAGAMLALEKRDKADAAELLAAMCNTIDAEIHKASDKPAEKTGTSGRKRFTPARVAKLLNALKNISEVMKEVDANSLTSLFQVAKSEPTAEGEVAAKALEPHVVQDSDDKSEVEALNKRLVALEAAGISKSLGGNDSPTAKNAKESIFENVVF